MGYFSNGNEGMQYQTKWCDQCVHEHPEWGCPVWSIHMTLNYEECGKKNSVLHKIIPRDKEGWNEQCIYFVGRDPDDKTVNQLKADTEMERKYKAAMATKNANETD